MIPLSNNLANFLSKIRIFWKNIHPCPSPVASLKGPGQGVININRQNKKPNPIDLFPFASAVQYISMGHCDFLADIVEHAALVKCVLKKQIIDGSACRSGCKSPFVFCDSKSTENRFHGFHELLGQYQRLIKWI